jgi:hypothetical protein
MICSSGKHSRAKRSAQERATILTDLFYGQIAERSDIPVDLSAARKFQAAIRGFGH